MERLTSKKGKHTRLVLRSILKRDIDSPISSTTMFKLWGVNDATVRAIVSEARVGGVPIGSGGDGYFLAQSLDELEGTFDHLDARITRISRVKNGLLSAFSDNGQLELRAKHD